jgi:transcriptional regulator with XRE-family HTH domain
MVSAAQLRAARAFLKIGLKELAARARVSTVAISKYENNKITRQIPPTNAAIEKAFNELGIEFEDGEGFERVTLRK